MRYFYNGLFGNLNLGDQHFPTPGEYIVTEETTNHFFWSLLVLFGAFTKLEDAPVVEEPTPVEEPPVEGETPAEETPIEEEV